MPICWSLLNIETCSSCSQVLHSVCSITAEPTYQILLIIYIPSQLEVKFKSCEHGSWRLNHDITSFESELKWERWVNFDDNGDDDNDDDDNDDNDDEDLENEKSLWCY